MFSNYTFNKFYTDKKNIILNDLLDVSNKKTIDSSYSSNFETVNNNYIKTLPLYKEIQTIIKKSIQKDNFNFQFLCLKIVENIYSKNNITSDNSDDNSDEIINDTNLELLPHNIIITIEFIIYLEIGILIHIIFLNYYYQDNKLNKKYIENMISIENHNKGNFLLLCLDLLINQGTKIQQYIYLIDDPQYLKLKQYFINDPSCLHNKMNMYLDNFIIDIFDSIENNELNNSSNNEIFNNHRKIIIDLITNLFNNNKIVLREIMDINFEILSENDLIKLNRDSKENILQIIETIFNFNIMNFNQL